MKILHFNAKINEDLKKAHIQDFTLLSWNFHDKEVNFLLFKYLVWAIFLFD